MEKNIVFDECVAQTVNIVFRAAIGTPQKMLGRLWPLGREVKMVVDLGPLSPTLVPLVKEL